MNVKRLATALSRKHETRNPFQLARSMGFHVIQTPLEGVRGFYQRIKRCHIIYIDNRLEECEAAFVCAHEIGHSMLHKGMNRIFMDTNTYMATSRYEWEADRFAVDLLFDDCDLRGLIDHSTPSIAECLGVSVRLAEYRMSSILPGGEF